MSHNSCLLWCTNSISINDNLFWISTILAFELNQGFLENKLKSIWHFFTLVSLKSGGTPVFGCSLVNRSAKGKDWIVFLTRIAIHIHSTNHCHLIQVWKISHCPRFTTYFSTHLNQNFAAYWSDVFASRDGVCEYNLRWNRNIFKKKSFQIIIKWCFSLLPRKQQHNTLNTWI